MKENNLKYSVKTTVEAESTDRYGFATNAFILKSLEDAATAHAESVGYGFTDMRKKGLTWMLVDWKVKVLDRPKSNDKLLINTWSRGTAARAFAMRDFEIIRNDKVIAIASSRWILFDINEKKIARTTDEDIGLYLHEKNLCVFESGTFEKIPQVSSNAATFPYIVKQSDIDGNGHVHNLVYLDIATETIGNEKHDNFSITYKKEILPSDNVLCFVEKIGDETVVEIRNRDTLITNAAVKFS